MAENLDYLTKQLITYLGNKRKLLPYIQKSVINIQKKLGSDKTVNVDLFSGSGSVARLLKQYSSIVIANDLEHYSYLGNQLFLKNADDFNYDQYSHYLAQLKTELANGPYVNGIIAGNYAPKETDHILAGERAFYTHENAQAIDTARAFIENVKDTGIQQALLAELLIQASVHANTSGVFKGFYKNAETHIGQFGGNGQNALSRIMGSIDIGTPVLSNYKSQFCVYQQDAATVFSDHDLHADITYLDPPYNQHPYGSNYFMLNEIASNRLLGELSTVSGIPQGWNHSDYNSKKSIGVAFDQLLGQIRSRYVLISYNNEGFLSLDDLVALSSKHGKIDDLTKITYNAFRGSRNLSKRALHTQEYLITVKMTNF